MKIYEIISILRNPFGRTLDQMRDARLAAADLLEQTPQCQLEKRNALAEGVQNSFGVSQSIQANEEERKNAAARGMLNAVAMQGEVKKPKKKIGQEVLIEELVSALCFMLNRFESGCEKFSERLACEKARNAIVKVDALTAKDGGKA